MAHENTLAGPFGVAYGSAMARARPLFRKRPENSRSYSCLIEDWSAYYGFGESSLIEGARFSENASLEVYGRLTEPLTKGIRRVKLKLVLMAIDLNIPRRDNGQDSIGELWTDGDLLEGTALAPFTCSDLIVPAMTAGKVDTLIIFAEELKYGHAKVFSFVVRRGQYDESLFSEVSKSTGSSASEAKPAARPNPV